MKLQKFGAESGMTTGYVINAMAKPVKVSYCKHLAVPSAGNHKPTCPKQTVTLAAGMIRTTPGFQTCGDSGHW